MIDILNGASTYLEKRSEGYKKANKWFKENHVARTVNGLIVVTALSKGYLSGCTGEAPQIQATPIPTEAPLVVPPPTEAPAQIDYFANTEDGISTELQSKVDQYLKTNDPNGKLEGGFSVVVDDGNDSTSPVEREFAITTDSSGELRIVIDNSQGTRALVPDSITNEGSTKQVDPITGLPIFIYETDPKNSPADFVLNYYPYLDLGQLPNIKQMPIPIHIPNDSLGNLARKAESPALDPEAWNQYGNVLVKNANTKVYDNQLVVNPDRSDQFAKDGYELCNLYSFITSMASVFDKTRAPSDLPAKYQSFENYMSQVVNPAIETGKPIEGWRLVGHNTFLEQKLPYQGMIEPLPNFDPSVCSIKIGGKAPVYSGSPVVSVGIYQIGMNVITKDGKPIRELNINIEATNRSGYGTYFANPEMPDSELALSYSQLIYTAKEKLKIVANGIATDPSMKDEFVNTTSNNNVNVGFQFTLPGTGGVDLFKKLMEESPDYFTTPTP